jgi:predicted Zn-dependent protease
MRQNQQGQVHGIEVTVATGPANRNYLLVYGAKNAQALQSTREKIRQAESSFRAMTSTDVAAAHPWTIKLLPYKRGTLPQLAKQSPLSGNSEQQLRLLNGFYAGGEPQSGQLIKVIE